jgi:hypothetical protein
MICMSDGFWLIICMAGSFWSAVCMSLEVIIKEGGGGTSTIGEGDCDREVGLKTTM